MVLEGNTINRVFSEQAWANMVESFNENFGLQLDKNVLENQYIHLMKQYNDISDLLGHSGFLWDEEKQMVVANNDDWEVYMKEHPDTVSYRDKVLDSYSDLCKIFGEVLDEKPSVPILGVETDCCASDVILDGPCGNLQTPDVDIHSSDQQRKRPIATPDIERASKKPSRRCFPRCPLQSQDYQVRTEIRTIHQ